MSGWPEKKPRTFRPGELLPRWYRLQRSVNVVEAEEMERMCELSKNPFEFLRQIVRFEPTEYQKQLIEWFVSEDEHQFIAARWCRQSGKSWTVAALLLWYAVTHADSNIAVVAPSLRQAKFIIRRIAYFLKRLPPGMYFRPLRTLIRFTNGSIIEAFPNSPDTIRGPTLDIVYADEMNFMPNDEEMYDAILFTLGTTNGKFVCSSTPWNTDSIFYKIFNHEDFSDFSRSHVTWQQAQEPRGPLKKNILEKIRKQFGEDPWRWKREIEAEWAEDETTWLSQSLITKCIATEKTLGEELELCDFERYYKGNLYAGLDLGRVKDYSVLVVIEEVRRRFFLRHVKIFGLGTSYASVIGYVKTLQDRWDGFCKIRVDSTNQDYVVEDMKNSEIDNVEGVHFTLPRKQEMATLLKQRMINNQFWYPYFTWERPYHSEFVTELNVERFELRKDGSIALNHPSGTHDDVFWSVCLALYSTVEMVEEPEVWVVPR